MMITHIPKRPHHAPRKRLKCFAEPRNPRFFVQAALIAGILLSLMVSAVSVTGAGESRDRLAASDGAGLPGRGDAAGMESTPGAAFIDPRLILGAELPVIYGVDIREVRRDELTGEDMAKTDIFFDVLSDDIKLEILSFAKDAPKEFHVGAQGPQILIYHTHTQEAYRQVSGEEYVEVGSWRTAQENSSVVAVGAALKKELESHGYAVLHDKTNHEPPTLKTAYARSGKTMERYAKDYPTISVFIDVHRDAYGDTEAGSKDYVTVNGQPCARLMFVVGTGEATEEKPNYESNYKLALAVTNQLESIKKGFTRPIRVKTNHYNQYISDMCLLIEVGHNANSLEQALNSTRYVALALSRVLEPS